MAKPGSTQPDLVTELARMQKRLDDLERRPVPTSLYDSYPCIEWAAVNRQSVYGNLWSSCSISNVTGMKFDRIEARFITNDVVAERSEAELRLAAFKYSHVTRNKTCVAASKTVRLTGNGDASTGGSTVGTGKWRWIHGLPRGWDLDNDSSEVVYTIELQHRNPNDCLRYPDEAPYRQLYGFSKLAQESGEQWTAAYVRSASDPDAFAAGLKWGSNTAPQLGWYNLPQGGYLWNGAYSISNLHYCVGMAEEQLPEATEDGYFWYAGGNVEVVRPPNTQEAYMQA